MRCSSGCRMARRRRRLLPRVKSTGLGAKAEQRPEDADAADPDEASADLQSEPEPDA